MSRKITAFLLAMLMLPLSAMNTLADENDPDLSINEISFSDDTPTGGDEITITAEPAEGYYFDKWSNGWTGSPLTFKLNVDMEITAEFKRN